MFENLLTFSSADRERITGTIYAEVFAEGKPDKDGIDRVFYTFQFHDRHGAFTERTFRSRGLIGPRATPENGTAEGKMVNSIFTVTGRFPSALVEEVTE